MAANDIQVGGDHYKTGGEEHWDRVARLGLDYFQGQITKYVERCWKKNGIQDLQKAQHFLTKYLEIAKGAIAERVPAEAAAPLKEAGFDPAKAEQDEADMLKNLCRLVARLNKKKAHCADPNYLLTKQYSRQWKVNATYYYWELKGKVYAIANKGEGLYVFSKDGDLLNPGAK